MVRQRIGFFHIRHLCQLQTCPWHAGKLVGGAQQAIIYCWLAVDVWTHTHTHTSTYMDVGGIRRVVPTIRYWSLTTRYVSSPPSVAASVTGAPFPRGVRNVTGHPSVIVGNTTRNVELRLWNIRRPAVAAAKTMLYVVLFSCGHVHR